MEGRVRCFVGLPLPGDWQSALDRMAGRLGGLLASRVGWTRPGNWHVTLKFLGDVDGARLPELRAALRGVAFAPFLLRLGGAGCFPPPGRGLPRTLWVGLSAGGEDCARLAAGLERALAPLGFAAEARGFRAHVTLGRVREVAAGDDFAAALADCGGAGAGPARAGVFVLWRSILGPGGPKYAALEVFPARGQDAGPEGTPA